MVLPPSIPASSRIYRITQLPLSAAVEPLHCVSTQKKKWENAARSFIKKLNVSLFPSLLSGLTDVLEN